MDKKGKKKIQRIEQGIRRSYLPLDGMTYMDDEESILYCSCTNP